MTDIKTFENVSAITFDYSKVYEKWYLQGNYKPWDGDHGDFSMTVTGHQFSRPSNFQFKFDFDPPSAKLTYTLVESHVGDFPLQVAWDRIQQAIERSRGFASEHAAVD
jgi:hypothetical protein